MEFLWAGQELDQITLLIQVSTVLVAARTAALKLVDIPMLSGMVKAVARSTWLQTDY